MITISFRIEVPREGHLRYCSILFFYLVCFNYLVNFFILKIKKRGIFMCRDQPENFFKIQRKRTKKQKKDERKVYLRRTLGGHNYTFFIIIIL